MKIGFAARWSPLDKRSWSGTSYYAYQQISRRHEMEIFQFKWPWYVRERLTTQKSFNRKLFGRQTAVEYIRSYARYFSGQLEKELQQRPVDVLFVSASPQLIAYANTRIPIIYHTDATFQQLQGYYSNFSNLPQYNIRQGIALDKLAFQKAAHCILSSDWNKRSAMEDYGITADKLSVVPLGANMDQLPTMIDPIAGASSCRLLFLGVEWERKGGDIALETFRLLQQRGLQPQLHIIGCVPPVDLSKEKDITVIPFLDKNKADDGQQLEAIFQQTDFLLLPTRAECAGVVFSEAAAYGIPSITTDTGGVSTYVREGINGLALPFTAGAPVYAAAIEAIANDKERLLQLRKSSRHFYNTVLNWQHWGGEFEAILQRVLK